MSEYPSDEFDRVPPTGRRGAHRGRQSPFLSLGPVLLVLVAVAAVVFGVTTLLGGDPPESVVTGSVTDPTGDAGLPGTGLDPTAPGVEPTPETPVAPVDRSVELRVLNGTTTRGLAARGAEQLGADGWTVSGTDNYPGPEIPTTVFFAEQDLEATARAVADALGGAQVQLDAEQTGSLVVVLSADYADRAPAGT